MNDEMNNEIKDTNQSNQESVKPQDASDELSVCMKERDDS